MVITVIGGIGLFLLGMTLMTDGLKTIGGETLKKLLSRFAGGSVKGLISGALLTTLIQSSAATTLTSIGFVSAGLLTFNQALSIIFGANLGTTSTGWLVSLLGLKYSIASLALPLIGAGALLRLSSNEKWQPIGTIAAGFGLIFVGLDYLQNGMASVSNLVDLSNFGTNTFLGKLLLVGIGMILTVLLQSSSVAVAATMTALHAGTISFDQACAMVIGQNVGTTFTTLFAVIGATIPAKRAALGHILFNVLTGIIAFIFLSLLSKIVVILSNWFQTDEPAIQLALFLPYLMFLEFCF
jgi:phosphate:Na+ symporter